jgi:hypothetical protein
VPGAAEALHLRRALGIRSADRPQQVEPDIAEGEGMPALLHAHHAVAQRPAVAPEYLKRDLAGAIRASCPTSSLSNLTVGHHRNSAMLPVVECSVCNQRKVA